MRRKIGIGIMSISIIILGTILLSTFGQKKYNELVLSADVFSQMAQECVNREDTVPNVFFDGQKLFFSNKTGTFYYSLVEGSESAFNPLVKTEHNSNVFFSDYITEDSIKNNKQLSVIIQTESGSKLFNLVCTTLPIMNINCSGQIDREYVDMDMTLFDNYQGTMNRVTVSDGQIKLRGASSGAFEKKLYRISLNKESMGEHTRNNHTSLLGMRQDEDWILYAGYNDQEKVRNVFSQNLWKYSCATDNADGIDTGTEYKYLELFINGEYNGLYALCYPIDSKLLAITDSEGGALYKKNSWDNEEVLSMVDGAVSGYEVKTSSVTDTSGATDSVWIKLIDYYSNLSSNSTDSEALLESIDVDNAIDIYLFINLIQGSDNAGRDRIKNMFLAFYQDESGKDTMLYCPWDLDLTWGNQYTDVSGFNSVNPYSITSDKNVLMESGYLYQIMLNGDTDIFDRIQEKYWMLRETTWSEEFIDSMIDKYEKEIFDSGAYLRDMNRWPQGSYINPGDKLSVFRSYVHDRLSENDEYMRRMTDYQDSSIFVQRSAKHKDFENATYLMEIQDNSYLQDSDYVDFFEFIGINMEEIKGDTRYVIGNKSEGFQYYDSFGVLGDITHTNVGDVSLERVDGTDYESDEWYSVCVDGVRCFNTSPSDTTGMRFYFIIDNVKDYFYFNDNFFFEPDISIVEYLEQQEIFD